MKVFFSILLFCVFVFSALADEKALKVKEKVGEAKLAISDYAYSKKKEFVAKTQDEVNRLKKDLAGLEVIARKAAGSSKKEAEQKIQAVEGSINKLNDELDELKSATEENWNEVKNKYSKSVKKVKGAIKKSREWLSEKIAP